MHIITDFHSYQYIMIKCLLQISNFWLTKICLEHWAFDKYWVLMHFFDLYLWHTPQSPFITYMFTAILYFYTPPCNHISSHSSPHKLFSATVPSHCSVIKSLLNGSGAITEKKSLAVAGNWHFVGVRCVPEVCFSHGFIFTLKPIFCLCFPDLK